MIPISLPSGKVVFITLEQSLNDDFMRDIMARDDGYEIDNPFDPLVDRMRDPLEWTLPDIPNELSKNEIEKIKKEVGKNKN